MGMVFFVSSNISKEEKNSLTSFKTFVVNFNKTNANPMKLLKYKLDHLYELQFKLLLLICSLN